MPHPPMTHRDDTVQGQWNTDAIRDLLTAAFDDGELTTLCFDHFKSVYDSFAIGMSKAQKIQLLIDFCVRRNLLEKLGQEIKEHNRDMYLAVVYQRGVSAYRKGKLSEARRAFQEVVDIDPKYQDAAQLMNELKQQLEATYQIGVSAHKERKLLEARRALLEVANIDPEYADVARLLAQVRILEKRRQVIQFSLASAVVIILVALVITTVVLWPRVNLLLSPAVASPTPRVSLSDTRVSFSIISSNGKIPVPVSNTITLASSDVVLIETSVMADSSPFPRALSFQYYAPRGRVPSKVSGPSTSYVAPARPGPDVITVSVTDQATRDTLLRHINIVVKEKE